MSLVYKTLILIINISFITALNANSTENEVISDYNKTKEILQTCLNELLNVLKRDIIVNQNPKIHLLVVMHNNLDNIAYYNWKMRHEIKNKAKVDDVTVTTKVYEFVEDAIHNQNLSNAKDYEVDITEETTNFYADFVNRLNALTVKMENSYLNNFFNNMTIDQKTITNEDNIKPDINSSKRRLFIDDLSTWDPSEDKEIDRRRVFGGKGVNTIRDFPFIVSIHVFGQFSCTGAIVNKKYVLTAASCVQSSPQNKPNKSPVEIRVGSDNTGTGGVVLQAVDIIFHPRYNSVTLKNNLAMIEVEGLHTNRTVKKIRLANFPTNMPRNFANIGVFILGWGDIEEKPKQNKHLVTAFLEMVPLDDCVDVYTGHYVSTKHFCAGLTHKHNGVCNGYVGGPAVVLGTMVGLASFGPKSCHTSSSPTVFINVAYYTSWIRQIMNRATPQSQSDSIINFAERTPDNPHEDMMIKQVESDEDDEKPVLRQMSDKNDQIDYGDSGGDGMDILFESTTTMDAAHHVLANKSVVNIMDFPYKSTKPHTLPTAPIWDIGLPKDVPYEFIEKQVDQSPELRNYVNNILSKGTLFKAHSLQGDEINDEILDSVEAYDNFEYEEGIAIEAPKNYKIDSPINTAQRKRRQPKNKVMNQYLGSQYHMPIGVLRPKTVKDNAVKKLKMVPKNINIRRE